MEPVEDPPADIIAGDSARLISMRMCCSAAACICARRVSAEFEVPELRLCSKRETEDELGAGGGGASTCGGGVK